MTKEIEIQKKLLEQYKEDVEALTLKFTIVTAVMQLDIEEEKETAQLKLMEFNIDAENEDEIAEYKVFDITQLKNDKLRMESKLSALENKLQKHEKHLPDVIELEKQEVLLVYQEYLKEFQLDEEQIGKVLTDNDLFENTLFPMSFLKIYKSVKK